MRPIKKDFSLNCQGSLLDLSAPIVMGILNITPDSFFDGGKNDEIDTALNHCQKMIEDGAKIIDIGPQSSRPNAEHLSADDEIKRLKSILPQLSQSFKNAIFSIDTFYSKTADYAINNGCSIINDISAGDFDKNMLNTVKGLNVPYIAMHKQGNPQNMQHKPQYKNVVEDVFNYLYAKKEEFDSLSITDYVLDPGFGFDKTIDHNYQLLNGLEVFSALNAPLMVGVSRKSMIYQLLNTDADNALNGTTSLNTIALFKGAKILRVHDVREAVECTKIMNTMLNAPD